MEKKRIYLSQFKKNPVIFQGSDFSKPPIGKVEFKKDKVYIVPRDAESERLIEDCNMNFEPIFIKGKDGGYEMVCLTTNIK